MNDAVSLHAIRNTYSSLAACHDLTDLFTGKRSGHLGEYGYASKAAGSLVSFFNNHPDYYVLREEGDLLREDRTRKAIANLIYDTKRLIVIGPGPVASLKAKEGALIPHLQDLESIILVDISSEFCSTGTAYLRDTFKDQNIAIDGRNIDFKTAHLYLPSYDHTTVTVFGGTGLNAERIEGEPFPEAQMTAFLSSMKHIAEKGEDGLVIVSYDSCSDPSKIIQSYRHPDLEDFIWGCFYGALSQSMFLPDDISESKLRKCFEYQTIWNNPTAELSLISKKKVCLNGHTIESGTQLPIMNSVKPSIDLQVALGESIGMKTGISLRTPTGVVVHAFTL